MTTMTTTSYTTCHCSRQLTLATITSYRCCAETALAGCDAAEGMSRELDQTVRVSTMEPDTSVIETHILNALRRTVIEQAAFERDVITALADVARDDEEPLDTIRRLVGQHNGKSYKSSKWFIWTERYGYLGIYYDGDIYDYWQGVSDEDETIPTKPTLFDSRDDALRTAGPRDHVEQWVSESGFVEFMESKRRDMQESAARLLAENDARLAMATGEGAAAIRRADELIARYSPLVDGASFEATLAYGIVIKPRCDGEYANVYWEDESKTRPIIEAAYRQLGIPTTPPSPQLVVLHVSEQTVPSLALVYTDSVITFHRHRFDDCTRWEALPDPVERGWTTERLLQVYETFRDKSDASDAGETQSASWLWSVSYW